MRIGMMADLYKPHVSGVTNHIALNKAYMESIGHEVFVFTFGEKGYQDNEPNVIRTTGISIEVPLVDGRFNFNIKYDRSARDLLISMDIVHVHHPFISGMLAARYCRPHGIPIVVTNHTRYDLYHQAYVPMLPENIGDGLLHAYFSNFFRLCDLVIVPSAGAGKALKRLGVDSNIEIIPNGIDLDFVNSKLHTCQRENYGFEETDVILIFVGRLGPEKNVSFLLRSFAYTVKRNDMARLLIVGEGPDKNKLEKETYNLNIESRVEFTGRVPYDEIPGHLGISNAFVTASVTEVHPLTLIEAMAAGLPALGIRSPGIEDIIDDGKNGYLVNNNQDEFQKKMLEIVSDAAERKRMGIEALEQSKMYSVENNSRKLLEHYRYLIASRGEGRPNGGNKFEKLLSRIRL